MSDFNEYIKDAFKPNNGMKVPGQAWNDFMDYSKARQKTSKGLMYWLIPSLLALLFLSNIFWWNYSEQKIEHLLSETVIRDTIYLTEIITKEIERSPANDVHDSDISLNKSAAHVQVIRMPNYVAYPKYDLPNFEKSLAGLNFSSDRRTLWKKSTDDLVLDGLDLAEGIHAVQLQSLSHLETINFSSSYFDHNRKAPGIPIYIRNQDYSEKSFWEKIQPKSLSLFAETGYAFSPEWQLGEFNGYSQTVGLSTSFSRSARLLIGLTFQNLSFSTDEYLDPEILPLVEGPENSTLYEIAANSRDFLVNTQFEYNLHTIGRLRPFLGIGLTYGISTLRFIEYNFEGPGVEIEIYVPDQDPRDFLLAGFNLGTDINLLDRLDLRTSFNSRFRLSGFEHKGLYSLNAGLYWHF